MKNPKSFLLRQLAFLLGFSVMCLALVSSAFFISERIVSFGNDKNASVPLNERVTVIIDAGHGGRDGGASSDDGTLEKDLNLAVAKKVKALLSVCDINIVMTRESDIMLAEESSTHKKRDDLNARLHTADKYENAIFVSIHMNKFPVKKYSGLQVYYSKNNAGGKILADMIGEKTALFLQKDNDRKSKAADSSIYILHNIRVPAVLVECGFLSNDEETKLLKNEEYQDKLATLISMSILDFISDTST